MARSTDSLRASARTAGVALMPCAPPGPSGASGAAASASTCVPTFTAPTTVPASSWALPAPSKPTSGAPRWTISPGCANSLATWPLNGDGISTMALAVSTDSSGWSAATLSPGLTCHAMISASCNPSPRSGSLKVRMNVS